MRVKAVIYARYSTDLQNERSVEDQIVLCRAYAVRADLTVVDTYADRAVSGASTAGRLDWQRLMHDAVAGRFSIVIAEDLDRISRDEADYHTARKRLAFCEVEIHTAHGGVLSGIEGTIQAMMASNFLVDLARKIHRGQAGSIRSGKRAGGRAYGYRPVLGKPGEVEIVAEEAEIVRRIYHEYAARLTAREIAARLNRDGVPSPRGGIWNASTINGARNRGTGILGNELHNGQLVWNRMRKVKDPDTGRRIGRVNPKSEWMTVDVPHVAIIDPGLYAKVIRRRTPKPGRKRLTQRPRRLLSGLLRCGVCGSGMAIHDRDRTGKSRVRCSRYRESGACSHRRMYYLEAIETIVLEGLRDALRGPDMIRRYVETHQKERKRLAKAEDAGRAKTERRLGAIDRELKRYVKSIGDGSATIDMIEDEMLVLQSENISCRADSPNRQLRRSLCIRAP